MRSVDFTTEDVPGKYVFARSLAVQSSPLESEALDAEKSKKNDNFDAEVECYVNTVLVNVPTLTTDWIKYALS